MPHQGPDPSQRDVVPAKYLADTAEVRRISGRAIRGGGRKPVTRHTLLTWREKKGFPAPLDAPKVTGELWDVREVRKWLRDRQEDQ